MDDLKQYSVQIGLVHGFAQGPSNFLSSVKNLLNVSEYNKLRMGEVYMIFHYLIVESKDASELIEKLSNSSDSKVQSQLNSLKLMLETEKPLFESLKKYASIMKEEIIGAGALLPIIRTDSQEPLDQFDEIFLNKISRSSLTEETNGFTKENILESSFETRVATLFHKVPTYFEQAFSNADVEIQDMLLKCIEKKYDKSDPNQVNEYNNLSDLYMLADIDNLSLKIKNVTSLHQAFKKILVILEENRKPRLINRILKENIIMSAIFQIDAKKPYNSLLKMFVASSYPYNGIILDKYRDIMIKKPLKERENGMAEIINLLKKDESFKKAYAKYEIDKETISIKRQIDNVFSTISGRTRIEIKSDISRVYDLLMKIDSNSEIVKFNTILEYSKKLNQIIIENNLHMENEINEKVNARFIHKLEAYSTNGKLKGDNKSVVSEIDPIDVWYDINRIFEQNEVTNYTKIYLKYPEKYAYEFIPGKSLKVSNRELPMAEISALPESMECIICSEVEDKRFNILDLYINRLYQKIFKMTFREKIKFKDSKNLHKNKAFTTADKNAFKRLLNDYAALAFIVQKDRQFFKDLYKSKGKELLKEIISFEKSYSDICENVELTSVNDYTEMFSDRELLKRLYTELDKNPLSVENNMNEFLALAPIKKQQKEKIEGFSK